MGKAIRHYGILGMHWGVRRQRGVDGLVVKTSSNSASDYENARALKKKGIKNLSNAELKAYVDRANLESQFEKLNKRPVGAGRKFVQDILVNSGKQALTTFASKQMSDRLEKLVKK